MQLRMFYHDFCAPVCSARTRVLSKLPKSNAAARRQSDSTVSERQEDAEADAGHSETEEEEQRRDDRRSHAETAQKPPGFRDAHSDAGMKVLLVSGSKLEEHTYIAAVVILSNY